MAGGATTYSGLATKVRAMRKNLLSREEFIQLTELVTVNEAVSYLRNHGSYAAISRNETMDWHRGQVEDTIRQELWTDLEKLYLFSNGSQRKVLELVFFRYETNLLKDCLKRLYQDVPIPIPDWGSFFRKHLCFSLEDVALATSMEELEHCLMGTRYEAVLQQARLEGGESYIRYVFGLDLNYYVSVWRGIQKQEPSALKTMLLQIYGTQIDWLNIMWVYRSRRFSFQKEADLYALLIPIRYRLRHAEFEDMIHAESVEQMERVLQNTVYFRGRSVGLVAEDEAFCDRMIERAYQQAAREHPMSMAPVLLYLYEREMEQKRLTSVIEGIRYQIPFRDIRSYIGIA